MKNLIFSFALFALLLSCHTQKTIAEDGAQKTALMPEKNDEGEWDLQVIDTQYDYFLNAIARPMSFYTESTLKTKNALLVSEWNSLYVSGKYRNIIESSIEYDSRENYGMKFEYKLYQVFAYVQWKYGLRLQGLSMTEVR